MMYDVRRMTYDASRVDPCGQPNNAVNRTNTVNQ
jgi:hypothetical protein